MDYAKARPECRLTELLGARRLFAREQHMRRTVPACPISFPVPRQQFARERVNSQVRVSCLALRLAHCIFAATGCARVASSLAILTKSTTVMVYGQILT
jgi:hypothetical protein